MAAYNPLSYFSFGKKKEEGSSRTASSSAVQASLP